METLEWYAMYVRPRFERIAAFHLQSRNIEHFLPLRRVARQLVSGPRFIHLPLLPGYVFCKTHVGMHRSLLTIPGVLRISAGTISEQKINDLKLIIRPGLNIQQWRFTPTGKTVTIQSGALQSITGILDIACDTQVFIMSIEAIRRSIGVHIDEGASFSLGGGTAA